MKNIVSILIISIILSSCSNNKKLTVEEIIATNNLEQIRNKKSELDLKQQELSNQLQQLESKIKELDPQQKIPLITTYIINEEVFKHYVELQGSVDTKKNLVIFPEVER